MSSQISNTETLVLRDKTRDELVELFADRAAARAFGGVLGQPSAELEQP